MKRAVVVAILGSLAFSSGLFLHADAPRALRSSVVYPPQRIALRMSHSHPEHARLRCERCHEGATESDSSADLLIPQERACLPCHAAQIEHGDAGPEPRCALCHVDGATSEFPTPRLHFSHAVHAREGVGCTSCHAMEGVEVATVQQLPTMESCLRCHGGDGIGHHVEGASSECTTCHLETPDGRMRTRFGEGRMLPPQWLREMDHDRDFLVRHRWVAADEGDLCASCHTESECVACHDGRVRPSSVHRGDFLTTHGPMARRNQPECATCHNAQRFCTECHARLGLSPMSAPAATAGRAFHPPGWTDSLHAIEARRSLSTCTSCHAERDCVVCHGARGIGAGLSPHPPGFADGCRAMMERQARACQTCHGDLEALAARCR